MFTPSTWISRLHYYLYAIKDTTEGKKRIVKREILMRFELHLRSQHTLIQVEMNPHS